MDGRTSAPIALTTAQRDALRVLIPGLRVEAARGSDSEYLLTSGSSVGIGRVDGLTVELRPKIGIAPLLFLMAYAANPTDWRRDRVWLSPTAGLAEAIITLFTRLVQDALRPGVLHGYRQRDDVLTTVRGRIRIGDQIRTRTGLPLPVEVAYDDFTPDILENRLLRTAADVLTGLRLRGDLATRQLSTLRRHLHGITPQPIVGRLIPEPHWTRLNERYRPAVTLARLVLSGVGLEARSGGVTGAAVVVDMNRIFEEFVRAALREQLGLRPDAFPPGDRMPVLHLDEQHTCRLEPDLSWWRAGRCVLVGDCKYKKLAGTAHNPDVYQLLAYLTALRIQAGFLVYAKGEDVNRDVRVEHTGGKVLRVRVIDAAQPPTNVLAQVAALAAEFRASSLSEVSAVLQGTV